jgi:hypothetical protein
MNSRDQEPNAPRPSESTDQTRRATLRRLGRFAAITPPAVTLLLSAAIKPASAVTSAPTVSSRQFKEPVSLPQLQQV